MRLTGRLVLRIVGNAIAALAAGYCYEWGRKLHEKHPPKDVLERLTAAAVGSALGNLLADSDASPGSEETGTGRFKGVRDL